MQYMLQVPAETLSPHGIRPIRDQVLVRQDPKQERLSSGLYVPDVASRVLQEDVGTVEAVGPKCTSVAPGDRVMFRRRPDSALIPDAREGGPAEWINLIMLRDEDLIAVIEP